MSVSKTSSSEFSLDGRERDKDNRDRSRSPNKNKKQDSDNDNNKGKKKNKSTYNAKVNELTIKINKISEDNVKKDEKDVKDKNDINNKVDILAQCMKSMTDKLIEISEKLDINNKSNLTNINNDKQLSDLIQQIPNKELIKNLEAEADNALKKNNNKRKQSEEDASSNEQKIKKMHKAQNEVSLDNLGSNRFKVLAMVHQTDDDDVHMEENADDVQNKIINDVEMNFPEIKKRIIKKTSKSFSDFELNGIVISNLDENLNKNELNKNENKNKSYNERIFVEERDSGLKPPPIVAYRLDQKTLRNRMIKENSNKYLITKGANNNRVIIKSDNFEVYNKIINHLQERRENFFTFTPKGDRGLLLIMKGMSSDYSLEEIIHEFKSFDVAPDIESISQLKEGDKIKFNYFIIKLKPNILPDRVKNVRYVFNTRVYIEKFLRTDIIQCYNCQRPGHSATNCAMPTRCIRCGENHEVNQCKLERFENRKDMTCLLCRKKGHPSNYRGCSYIRRIIQEKKEKNRVINGLVSKQKDPIMNKVKQGISFADMVRGEKEKIIGNNIGIVNNKPVNKIKEMLDNIAYENFGCNYKEIEQKFMSFLVEYGACEDETDRSLSFLNFIYLMRIDG